MRFLWVIAGLISLALAAVAAIVPAIPAAVFLLFALYCFSRGSHRLHDWLISHPMVGPPIRDWRNYGAIRRPAKVAAMIVVASGFAISLGAGAGAWVLTLQAVVAGVIIFFVLSRPEGPRI